MEDHGGMEERLRVAAYGLCRDGDRLLLARYASPDWRLGHWGLPGGGIEHGEDPHQAVLREVAEETGYRVEVDALLGIGSQTFEADWGFPVDLHAVAVLYAVHVVAGELRHEVNGSSDQAAWVPVEQVPLLERALIIDLALQLERDRPASGHLAQLPPVGGLVHP